jgi:hypothetical protein
MMNEQKATPEAPPEQIQYANLLFYGCWGAIFLLFVTYFLYVSGMLSPHIPLNEISTYWSQGVHHYVEEAKVPLGWGWMGLVGKGDFLNFLGIAILAGLTIVGYLMLFPAYVKQKDIPFVVIVILEVLVLLLAASGILVVRH